MRSKFAFVSLVFLLSLSASGCAFSIHQTPLNYSYSGKLSGNGIKNPTKFLRLGEVKDSRDVTTPKMIMNMRNANGFRTSGGWEAEKPIADIVKDALGQGIKLSGLGLNNKADLSLSGEIIEYAYEFKNLRPFTTTLSSKLTVKIQLRDEVFGKILWRDTFFGQAEVQSDFNNDFAKEGFTIALNNLVTKIFTDDLFFQHLEK